MKRAKMKVVPFAREDVITTSGGVAPILRAHFYTDADYAIYQGVGRGYCYEDGKWFIWGSATMLDDPGAQRGVSGHVYTSRPSGLANAPSNTWFVANTTHEEGNEAVFWEECHCGAHSSLTRVIADVYQDHLPIN